MKKLLIILILMQACTSINKPTPTTFQQKIDKKDLEEFQRAYDNMETKQWSRVIPSFEKLAKKYTGQDIEWLAMINMASAYKELNQCEKARDLYQQVLMKAPSHTQSRIYLSLSYVYECLGDTKRILETLQTGIKEAQTLAPQQYLIEYPTRLALAYIRAGKNKQGILLQNQAYQNMEQLKQKFHIPSAVEKNFAHYLYVIGRSHIQVDRIQLKLFLKMASYYQLYLSQSILLESGKASKEAERELSNIYRKIGYNLNKQKQASLYKDSVQKLLDQLKHIAHTGKKKKMKILYQVISKKILKTIQYKQ